MPTQLRLSRPALLALLALLLALVAFLAVAGLVSLFKQDGGVPVALAVFFVPLICAVAAGVFLPAPRTRGWIKVTLAKHLFAHRYDYRAEWLRFSNTLGSTGDADADSLEVRAVRAIANLTDSDGGLLLVPDERELVGKASWNWPAAHSRCGEALTDLLRSGRIIALDEHRATDDPRAPEWLLSDERAWAIVPLLHFDQLAGAIVLARPALSRTLDWEDFDLLGVAGRSVASYLAEAQGQEAIAELQRFEEFNRRFAFIMHDIKNLVSQLSLLARNAERHAHNPAFRDDMVATLHSSTARMNEVLARLSQHHKGRAEPLVPVALGSLVSAVAAAKRVVHPVVVEGELSILATGDPARLETALTHLVQNAIEASTPHDPVTIYIATVGQRVSITVTDNGCGMTPEFVRTQLFRPFASTKDGGFGIGAYEARTLVAGMGGNLEVSSRLYQGTQFTIWLPAAQAMQDAA